MVMLRAKAADAIVAHDSDRTTPPNLGLEGGVQVQLKELVVNQSLEEVAVSL
ncbi:hypothetical protein CH063_13304 [Colletotrichum higginsianum]|uniref:Uncharacterized protein n=1 Tax=Colletotrichum higginsianum (strain IMI 349063) TaxID=759273 RepID=H1VTW2_COLHI|nr:hypothetical protein CH063_13304 [Colletotrichum higginsianum]